MRRFYVAGTPAVKQVRSLTVQTRCRGGAYALGKTAPPRSCYDPPAMSQLATATVGLSFPLQPGFNPPPLGASAPIPYTGIIPGEGLPIAGAGTYVVDLAMMPAAGLAYLEVHVAKADANGGVVTAPVKVMFTGGYLWVPPGGFCSVAAPGLASGGITSLSIVTTAAALVSVTGLG